MNRFVCLRSAIAAALAALMSFTTAQATTFTFNDFSDLSAFTLNGSAAQSGNSIRLTPDADNQAGSAFLTGTVNFAQPDYSFSTNFVLNSTTSGAGADGYTFVIHNGNGGANEVGGTGGNRGLQAGTGLAPFVAVEFITFSGSQIGIRSSTGGVVGLTSAPVIDNQGDQFVWVDYHGASQTMSVFRNNVNVKPGFATASGTVDLNTQFAGVQNLYVGFTAGTGGESANHDVKSWGFNSDVSPAAPPGPPTEVHFADFSDTSFFQLNGNAAQVGNRIRLTEAVNNQAGSAWIKPAIQLGEENSFNADFSFQLPSGTANPADGIVFALQTGGPGNLGGAGGNRGLDRGPQFLAIEINASDPGQLLIRTKGNVETETINLSVGMPGFLLGPEYFVWVDYDGLTDSLEVYFSDSMIKPAAPTLTGTVDLLALLGTDMAFVGFTAGTGGRNAIHEIITFNFVGQPPPVPEPMTATLGILGLAALARRRARVA
ncbi:MAG: L-type lectin-domain containing protein [Phycisphaeraceae bacterium]